jgi:hypothetical protein
VDDWTQKSIEGFDLLTVIAMVEACEPDLTMVRYIRVLSQQRAQWRMNNGLPVGSSEELVTCLQCAMDSMQRFNKQDPRVALIESARENRIVVLDIRLRHDGEVCRRCQPTLSPMGVTDWTGDLVCVRQK